MVNEKVGNFNKNLFISLYLFISLLIFSFISNPNGVAVAGDIQIFYIKGFPIIIHFYLTIVFVALLLLMTRKLKIYKSTIFLSIFACAALIPFFYIVLPSNILTHFVPVVISLLAFFIGSNYSGEIETINKLLTIFAIVISVQVIMVFINSKVPYMDIYYKYYMIIPVAASNVIASYLNPCFFIILCNGKKNDIKKIAVLSLIMVATILTKSRTGVIIILFMILWVFYKKTIRNGLLVKYIVTVIIVGCVPIILSLTEVQKFLMGFSNATFGSADFWSGLTTGRLDIYGKEILIWLKKPIFGNGIVYEGSYTGSHNLIIMLLKQVGILGCFLYAISIISVIKSFKKNANKEKITGLLYFLIVMLFHGMLEVNFFNYTTDMLFWFVAGIIVNYTILE